MGHGRGWGGKASQGGARAYGRPSTAGLDFRQLWSRHDGGWGGGRQWPMDLSRASPAFRVEMGAEGGGGPVSVMSWGHDCVTSGRGADTGSLPVSLGCFVCVVGMMAPSHAREQ